MKKKFFFFKQLDSMDCGPACLKMILSYYGADYSLAFLRKHTYAGKDGTSLLNISKLAQNVGFKTTGGLFTQDQLIKNTILPCIIHWNQNHFVVLYKIKVKKSNVIIYIADPGKGLLTYSEHEFKDHWICTKVDKEERGIVLLLEPSGVIADLNKQNKEKRYSKLLFLYTYFEQYKKSFYHLIVAILVGSILLLIFPFLMQSVVDIGIQNKNFNFILLILLAQLMLLFGRMSLDFIRNRILLHISARINISLISDFFIKLMKLPMAFFDAKLQGDLLQRIEDHKRIEKFLTTQSLTLLFSLFNFIVFGTVLFVYNDQIFLIFITGSLIYGLWLLLFLKKRKILDYKLFEQQAINSNKVLQLINGMQEIKLQRCEERKRWEWEDTQADLFNINLKTLSLQQIQEAGSIFINESKNLLITILSATAVIHGELTLGMMMSIQYIIGQLNSPVERIMNFVYQLQDVNISLERMSEIHSQKDEISKSRNLQFLSKTKKNDVLLDNITFQYEGPYSQKVLKNISLNIPEGKITAIVGASGSGKTTLIKLLLGYYTPITGCIQIGGSNLNSIDLSWWRTQCGVVLQDGFIFSESIAKNIAISSDDIDMERLVYASKIANIHDFVLSLPLQYNTIVGQDGQTLSQGQKQRLLIARAAYKNPRFIFLDEATNSLDANNEKTIIDNLSSFYKGKTVVIVAHRLSTVKNADQIVVLNNGCIVEQGNHDSLVSRKSQYYELVKNQLELGV